MEITKEETSKQLKKYLIEKNIVYDEKKLNEVLEYAQKIYADKLRYEGKTVFEHSIGVALEVIKLNMDETSIYASLLHEAPKQEKYEPNYIKEKFGEDVLNIINGSNRLCYLNYNSQNQIEIEKLRDMFMAIAKDVRVVIVKLADRIYNMRRIKELDENTQKLKAKETLEIYAPIAHRLGMSQIKSELEDIAFRILHKNEYQKIKKDIDEKRQTRQKYIEDRILEINRKLIENGINATIFGRPKHFYSIYKKMKDKGYAIDDLYDLLAIRIIVDSIKDCYTALGIVHEMYKPMPGRFKDYIAVPKTNMYQSLHTTVFGENSKPFEVQIRTWDMNRVAECGVAAHFLYKEKNTKMSETDKKILWLRQTLELQKDMQNGNESIKDLKIELFGEEVFVFTPKGEIKALPKDSTPVDYAYMIHQGIAEKMIGAKINSKIVPINTKLNNTDVVEIVTSSNSSGPSRDWLKFAKTAKAKNKIVSFLKKKGKIENIQKGKELFERELKKLKFSKEDIMQEQYIINMVKRCRLNTLEDVYENIGFGSISPVAAIRKLIAEYEKDLKYRENEQDLLKSDQDVYLSNKHKKIYNEGVIVEGINNCLIKFAKCCNPIPGDDIVGYITYGKGVSIHRKDCRNLNNLNINLRSINVKWQQEVKIDFEAHINILANERIDLISDILKKLQELKISIININVKNDLNRQTIIDLTIKVNSSETLQKVIKEIRKIDSIYEVSRVK